MNIKQLETFVWVSRLGSFRRAADQLGSSQPAISARIRELEEELGVSLLVRGSRPVQLSSHGRDLLRYAEEITELAEQLQERAGRMHAIFGMVRIGATHAVANWMPQFIAEMRARFTGIEIRLNVDYNDILLDLLSKGRVDIAIIVGPLDDPGIGYSPLYANELSWVASRSAKIIPSVLTPAALKRTPILTDSQKSVIHRVTFNWFRASGTEPLRLDTCSGPIYRMRLVETGEWIGVFPESAIAALADLEKVVVLAGNPPFPAIEFGIAYRLTADFLPTVKLVVEAARKSYSGLETP
ncbi:LysR family transcriptional regulator [Bradyrhizobium sp. HKCCYLR20261]|uniref:LysR family transcriptional regulator n=1 Tax=unclassified Bradyrhizobium TaxID=2631580 RepID=UPI003EB88E3D